MNDNDGTGGLLEFCQSLYEVVDGAGGANLYAQVFRDELFVNIFWLLLISSIATNLIYYYLINTILKMSWSKKLHWGGFMVLNFALVAGITALLGMNLDGFTNLQEGWGSHLFNYSMINGVYSIVIFFLFSMILKWKSLNASHVPF
jgi:hypothetical protein